MCLRKLNEVAVVGLSSEDLELGGQPCRREVMKPELEEREENETKETYARGIQSGELGH